MKAEYKEIGERILNVRTMRGYTREFLAGSAGISTKFLYEIETGKKGFSATVLKKLCRSLEVGSDYILTGRAEVAYDHKLVKTLELFTQEQREKVAHILWEIFRLVNNRGKK